MDILSHNSLGILTLGLNLAIAFLALRTRAEMAELKVWIFQNFQPLKHHASD